MTPHLAGKLEVLAYDGRSLTVIATAKGLTNHRIGDTDIAGGIRNCSDAPQMILAQMPWRTTGTATMVAVNLTNGILETQTFSQPFTEENISKALACQIQPGQP